MNNDLQGRESKARSFLDSAAGDGIAAGMEAEKKLKLFSAAMEEAMDAIQIFDLDGIIMHSNKAVEAIYGFTPEALVGRHIKELDADSDLSEQVILPVVRQRGRWSGEVLARHRSGREVPVWLSASLVRNESGEPVAMVGVIREITRRKQIEQEIRRNADNQYVINALLQRATERVSLDEILRYTLDQILSIPWLNVEAQGAIFLSDDGGTLFLKAQKGLSKDVQKKCGRVPLGACLCGRAASTREIQYAGGIDDRHDIRYDGMLPHGHYCVPLLFSGRVLGVIALYLRAGHERNEKEVEFLHSVANALAGIVQHKRTEEERETLIQELQDLVKKVSRSKQEWQETFDSITDLISITDKDSRIIKANRAFSDHYAVSPQELIGRDCHSLVYDQADPGPDCPHAAAIAEGKQSTRELISPDGRKTFLISVFPYFSPEQTPQGAISIMRDVTDRKEQETRLAMTERLAALGRMASGIAHEINNPLAAINGCAEGLVSRIDRDRFDPEFFRNYLKIIQEEIFRCKGITTGMLSFVKKDTCENKNMDINVVLSKSLDIIGFQGRLKSINVVYDLQPDMPPLRGSEGELMQVFLSLLTNALDAMHDKGTLTLSTALDNGMVAIAVSDQGSGISLANQSKIFDPFFTTKADSGGTGLGLAIASKIIANHNGTITVSSKDGKGATFRIMLPV